MITTLPKSLLEASSLLLEASLYESILLLEDRIDFLKKNNPSIDTSHDHLAIFDKPDEIIDHLANVGDPSKNKQHTQWILGQYKKKNVRQEDMYRVRDALTNFDKYKSKLDKKDINQYKTLGELEGAIHPLKGTAATNSEAKKETINKGRTLIHDNGKGLKVYRLEPNEEGKTASQEIYGGGYEAGGTHTSWCTAARSEHCMFDHYSKNEPLHVIHTPSGNVYQAHPSTKQLMDAKDEEFYTQKESKDGTTYIQHPDLHHVSKALEHIPNGWKLKFSHEFENVSEHDMERAINSSDSQLAIAAAKNSKISAKNAERAAQRMDDGSVRISLAKNHNIPSHVAEQLLQDKSSLVREAVASNRQLSPEVLESEFDKSNKSIFRSHIVGNPNASQELLKKAFSNDVGESVSIAAMSNPNITPETMRHGIAFDSSLVHHAVNNKNATPDILDKGLDDDGWKNQYTQLAAANHPNASKENLHKALDSSIEGVRSAAIDHPNSDLSHLERGLLDTEIVRRRVANSPKATPEMLDRLIKDKHESPNVKLHAVKNPNISPESLDHAVKNSEDDYHIIGEALKNKNISEDTVKHLARSNDVRAVSYVPNHPKLPKEDIERLSKHDLMVIRDKIATRKDLNHEQIRRLANDPNGLVREKIKNIYGVSNDQ